MDQTEDNRNKKIEFSSVAIVEAASKNAVSLVELQQMFPDISKSRICHCIMSLRKSKLLKKSTMKKLNYYKAT